ncbi:MAG: response regulator [Alphaproteobacteria bacterium]|nr:response regulator [Alphaproteobacteria bacterium]
MYKKLRVLAIDDEEVARQMLRKMLENLQFGAVDTAPGAEAAKAAFEGAPERWPNLVLCDYAMKPTDGLQFVAWMNSRPDIKARRVPVVIVTAHADTSIVLQAMQKGVSGYLVKPFTEEALRVRIQRAFQSPPPDPGTA